jgi:tetratricopeptide (TPR) repeat protein
MPNWAPIVIFAAVYTVVFAIISFGWWDIGGYGVETDAFSAFLPNTRKLLSGDFTPLDGFKGPGYHIAVALVSIVFRDLFISAKVVAILSAAAVIIVMFRAVNRNINQLTAWITVGLIAFNAQFMLYTVQVGTDMYFLALCVGTACLILEKRTLKWTLLAGALTGFTYLTRFNGLFLIAAGFLIMLLADRDERDLKARLLRTGVFLGAAFLVVLPWSLYTLSEGRGFFFNRNYLNVGYLMWGEGTVSWDQYWAFVKPVFGSFGDVIMGSWGLFIWKLMQNSVVHVWQDLTRLLADVGTGFTIPLAFLWAAAIIGGIVLAIRRWQWKTWPAILIGLAGYGILVTVFYGARFSLPMLPFYAVAAAIPVGLLATDPEIERNLRRAIGAGTAVLIAAGALAGYNQTQMLLSGAPTEVAAVARAMAGNVEPGAKVLARKPHIAWHLGLKYGQIPMIRTIDELPEIAMKQRAKYLYVSTIEAALRRPLIPLLTNPANAPTYLKALVSTPGARPSILYEFMLKMPPEITSSYKPMKRKKPDMPVKVRLARAYNRAGKSDLAQRMLTEVIAENPHEASAHLVLLEMELSRVTTSLRDPKSTIPARKDALRQAREVGKKMQALAQTYPESKFVQTTYADEMKTAGDIPEAVEAYKRAWAIDTTDMLLLGVIGEMQLSMNSYAAAESTFTTIVEKMPDDFKAHAGLGTAKMAMRKVPEAIREFKISMSMDSSEVEVRAKLADAYAVIGDSARSTRHWQEVIKQTGRRSYFQYVARRALGLSTEGYGP